MQMMRFFIILQYDSRMKVKVGFNLEWEVLNWYETICGNSIYGLNSGNKWPLGKIPEDVPDQINCQDKDVALDKIKKLVLKMMEEPKNKNFMEAVMEAAEKRWVTVEDEYLGKLSKMLDVPRSNFWDDYQAYFTFAVRSPFGQNAFMFSGFQKFIDSAAHEVMHIEFLRAYYDHCKEKGLSDLQIGNLKEVLTVLLNIDMSDILTKLDEGYTDHQEIRKKISELYIQNGGAGGEFTEFLDKAIDLAKDLKK